MQNISIVGAGVGGLTTGIYLQSEGYQVTIYEKMIIPVVKWIPFKPMALSLILDRQ
ncbi:NAD(P)-binding protein [Leuconostoc citreum]|uniref:NAD(P)-binding protein n=1 Tax=Leuconostoc citreum TaxID=33964 RepID=UPI00218201AE|nr:NAD(P)-binding protein [Leuconostoc citreum]